MTRRLGLLVFSVLALALAAYAGVVSATAGVDAAVHRTFVLGR